MSVGAVWDSTFEGLSDHPIDAFRRFLKTLRFDEITGIATSFYGINPSQCSLSRNSFQRGSCNVVLELSFNDGTAG